MKLWFNKGAWASKKAEEKLSTLEPEQVKRIAVIRHAALGDMVLTRPFLNELRRCFPNARIIDCHRGAPSISLTAFIIHHPIGPKGLP